MWCFSAVLLLALGLLLRRAFGLPWALGTLGFLAIEPNIAAHLPVVMTDLPVALTLGLATLCCGMLAATWRWPWAVAAGLAVGLALGSKHSAVAGLAGLALMLLVAVVMAWRSSTRDLLVPVSPRPDPGMRDKSMSDTNRPDPRTSGRPTPGLARRATLQAVMVAVLGLGTLWAMYGGHFHADAHGGDHFNRSMPDKVADLHIPAWRTLIGTADRLHLAPQSYLWGLADTVRAGVEGRGQTETRLWGTKYHGSPPWFTWPSIIAGKLPLALLAMSVLGLLALPWLRLSSTARWSLAMLAAMASAHLLALSQSQGTYGGIRHALPLVVALAIVAGAGVALAWQRRNRWLQVASVGLLAVALLTTIGEPRAWEFQNTLAGGTRDAWRQFSNEGMNLGQRSRELRDEYRRSIKPTGEPLYINTWIPQPQLRSYGMPNGNYAQDLDDTNTSGDYAGWFIFDAWAHLPDPRWNWNPDEIFSHMRLAKRLGNVEVWHGTLHYPDARAQSVYNRVMEFIYRDGKQDWPRVAARLAEVNAQLPYHVGAGVELGNALLRMGERDAARQAYQRLLVTADSQLDPLTRAALQRQVAALSGGSNEVTPLRNPWLE